MTNIRRQRGAFLVMMALLIVVLIGIAALALDFGRVVALRTEMQNAVDAAALAGAAELDGKDGAQLRARTAARNALVHDSRYARVAALLGDGSLPDAAFGYFCIIGAQNDVSDDDAPNFCAAPQESPRVWPAAGDADTHYLRVRLDPSLVADSFRVDLIFLPVLRLFNIDPATFVELNAFATAGRHFYECNYPPMVLCDPFEGSGTNFKEAMSAGQGIILREQGSGASWAAGNFGFLEPRDGGSGASDLSVYLADANLMGCTPPRITTKTGEMAQKTKAAINTRFDLYPPQLPKVPKDLYPAGTQDYQAWPPAPNIVEYAMDSTFRHIAGINDRFGNGDWDFDAYWAAKHPGVPKPNAWSNFNRPKRADVYAYEIGNGLIPLAPSHAAGPAERRTLHVAVASCSTLGLKGKSDAILMDPDGFAEVFVIRKADDPSSKLNIYGEYVGWSKEQDAHYHVDIQLYQ